LLSEDVVDGDALKETVEDDVGEGVGEGVDDGDTELLGVGEGTERKTVPLEPRIPEQGEAGLAVPATGTPPATETCAQPEMAAKPVRATRPPPPPPGPELNMVLPPFALITALEAHSSEGAVSQMLPPDPAPPLVTAQLPQMIHVSETDCPFAVMLPSTESCVPAMMRTTPPPQ